MSIEKAYQLFQGDNCPTLKGSLIDGEGDDVCMCAQGAILHYEFDYSFDDLRNLHQSDADKQLAEELSISLFHSILIRKVNDSQEGCPADVVIAEQDDEAAMRVLGPQGPELMAFGRSIDSLSAEQCDQLDAARAASWAAAWAASWAAAWAAARAAARAAAWDAALDAARDAARAAARAAARDAAWALLVRDLIGQHGFTQEHYDTLTKTWRTVVGPLHEDDSEIEVSL